MDRKERRDVGKEDISQAALTIIEARRNDLSNDDFGLLLELYETGSIAQAAAVLGLSIEEVESRYQKLCGKRISNEKQPALPGSREQPRKRRLSNEALKNIIEDPSYPFTELERMRLDVILVSPNMTVAAGQLNIPFKDLEKWFSKLRYDRNF